uniref:BLE2 protein n=1 Tax=Leersia perrieri TaxID=77586 RepID=A0A0D9V2Z3_9ORYZ
MAAATPPNEPSIDIAVPVTDDDQPVASALAGDDDERSWKTPQKWLNRFISTVAFMERTGNAVGTLAFTWATVVVLGGFSTDLREDFWYATAIVFLEAFRRLIAVQDNGRHQSAKAVVNPGAPVFPQLGDRDAVPLHHPPDRPVPPAPQQAFPTTWLLKRANTSATGRRVRALLLLAPYATIVALGFAVWLDGAPSGKAVATALPLVFMCFLCQQLIAVREASNVGGATQRRMISAPADDPSVPSQLSPVSSSARRARALLPKMGKILFAAYAPFVVYFMATSFGYLGLYVLFTVVVLGNFQIPVAVARVAISWARLSGRVNRIVTENVNFVPSLKIFYGLVLAQGALTSRRAACLTDPLSVVLRRWLARRCRLGTGSVDLYHEHAYDACMEDGLLASEDDVNIVTFAVETLSTDKPDRKKIRAGLRVLHCFLRSGGSKARLAASEVTTSTHAVATLIRMLGWEPDDEHDIRLLAANVVAELAEEIRIVRFPGTMQLIASLLDARSCYLKKEQGGRGISISAQAAVEVAAAVGNTTSDGSTCCCCFRKPNYHRRIKNLWSLPYEVALDDDEHALPVLGMLILQNLASDPENCAEIGRATSLISKAIGFIAYSGDDGEEHRREQITTSSLKLVSKLAGTKGEIGVVLRQKISDHPLLLSSLAGILEDDGHREQCWAPAMDIIAKLSVDDDTRQEVGEIRVIITKMVREFLLSSRDPLPSLNTHGYPPLWRVAGEALAMLTMGSPGNCLAILKEAKRVKEDDDHGHNLVNDLKNMLLTIRDEDGYRCVVVASLLQNLCAHSGDQLRSHPGSTEHLHLS